MVDLIELTKEGKSDPDPPTQNTPHTTHHTPKPTHPTETSGSLFIPPLLHGYFARIPNYSAVEVKASCDFHEHPSTPSLSTFKRKLLRKACERWNCENGCVVPVTAYSITEEDHHRFYYRTGNPLSAVMFCRL